MELRALKKFPYKRQIVAKGGTFTATDRDGVLFIKAKLAERVEAAAPATRGRSRETPDAPRAAVAQPPAEAVEMPPAAPASPIVPPEPEPEPSHVVEPMTIRTAEARPEDEGAPARGRYKRRDLQAE